MDSRNHQPIPEPIVATTTADYLEARSLLREYGAGIAGTVCAEGFAEECRTIELVYGPPQGRFLLLRLGCNSAGCVGLRNCGDGVIEMKRLYVGPVHRKHGLGKRLVEAAVSMARETGSSAIRLHTLPTMVAARHLYRSMGFVSMASITGNPCRGDLLMELQLE